MTIEPIDTIVTAVDSVLPNYLHARARIIAQRAKDNGSVLGRPRKHVSALKLQHLLNPEISLREAARLAEIGSHVARRVRREAGVRKITRNRKTPRVRAKKLIQRSAYWMTSVWADPSGHKWAVLEPK